MRFIGCALLFWLAHFSASACDLKGDDVTARIKFSDFQAKYDVRVACSGSVFHPPPVMACQKIDKATAGKIQETVANADADIAYTFYDAKLGGISGQFSFADFDHVSEAFEKKWGTPTSVDTKRLTTALGAAIESLELLWVRPGCTIALIQHHKRAGQSAFIISADWVSTTRADRSPDL